MEDEALRLLSSGSTTSLLDDAALINSLTGASNMAKGAKVHNGGSCSTRPMSLHMGEGPRMMPVCNRRLTCVRMQGQADKASGVQHALEAAMAEYHTLAAALAAVSMVMTDLPKLSPMYQVRSASPVLEQWPWQEPVASPATLL